MFVNVTFLRENDHTLNSKWGLKQLNHLSHLTLICQCHISIPHGTAAVLYTASCQYSKLCINYTVMANFINQYGCTSALG